jgi:hypothetical protein
MPMKSGFSGWLGRCGGTRRHTLRSRAACGLLVWDELREGHDGSMDEEELRLCAQSWVKRFTSEQGLSVKVTDPATIEYIAAIFASARETRLPA